MLSKSEAIHTTRGSLVKKSICTFQRSLRLVLFKANAGELEIGARLIYCANSHIMDDRVDIIQDCSRAVPSPLFRAVPCSQGVAE